MLDVLNEWRRAYRPFLWYPVQIVTWQLFADDSHLDDIPRSRYVSVRRAVAGLQRRGLIEARAFATETATTDAHYYGPTAGRRIKLYVRLLPTEDDREEDLFFRNLMIEHLTAGGRVVHYDPWLSWWDEPLDDLAAESPSRYAANAATLVQDRVDDARDLLYSLYGVERHKCLLKSVKCQQFSHCSSCFIASVQQLRMIDGVKWSGRLEDLGAAFEHPSPPRPRSPRGGKSRDVGAGRA